MRRVGFLFPAIFAAHLAACASVTPVPIRISKPRPGLLIPVEVNGVAAIFLLDTGTTHTVVSKDFSDRIGIQEESPALDVAVDDCGPDSAKETHVAELKSFRVGTIRSRRKPGQVLIADLPNFGAQFGSDVSGILGSATWRSADFVLNAQRPSFAISRRLGLAQSPGVDQITISGDRVYVPVEIDGHVFDFLLATGSGSSWVTQEVVDEVRPFNSDFIHLEITTNGSVENRRIPALHGEVRLGQVRIPQFTFLIGKENVLGLNLLRSGELSLSARDRSFLFRSPEEP